MADWRLAPLGPAPRIEDPASAYLEQQQRIAEAKRAQEEAQALAQADAEEMAARQEKLAQLREEAMAAIASAQAGNIPESEVVLRSGERAADFLRRSQGLAPLPPVPVAPRPRPVAPVAPPAETVAPLRPPSRGFVPMGPPVEAAGGPPPAAVDPSGIRKIMTTGREGGRYAGQEIPLYTNRPDEELAAGRGGGGGFVFNPRSEAALSGFTNEGYLPPSVAEEAMLRNLTAQQTAEAAMAEPVTIDIPGIGAVRVPANAALSFLNRRRPMSAPQERVAEAERILNTYGPDAERKVNEAAQGARTPEEKEHYAELLGTIRLYRKHLLAAAGADVREPSIPGL